MKPHAAIAVVACALAVIILPLSGGSATASSSPSGRCKTLPTTKDVVVLTLCGTIVEYAAAREKWDPGAARLKAQYGTDPVNVSAAGRLAWIKLASQAIKTTRGVKLGCENRKAAIAAYYTSQKDAAAFVLMCTVALDALATYQIYSTTFTHRRVANPAERQQVRRAISDFARNGTKIQVILTDKTLF